MDQPEHAIVVGVPATGGEPALTFAVEEARRSGSPVHLVHVVQLTAGEAYVGLSGAAHEAAQSALDAAHRRTKALASGAVPVTCELVTSGGVVPELVRRSEDARMVVLEHRSLGRLRRLATGSLSTGVAARAQSPTVVVPEGWEPGDDAAPVVTAAVQHPEEADAILRSAFDEARERGASLVVLHAWWLANGYDDVVADQATREEWADRATRALEPVLEPFRARYPVVPVTVDVRHSPPAEAVLAAAERSTLLVLGRRHHLLPLGTHLGPVARAALGHSPVPVLMTPEVLAETGPRAQAAGDSRH
jgi:nucleotide-binding universal stress UspA family protein